MLQDYLVKESSLNTLSFKQDESLALHSTFGIGGQCDYFVTPHTEEALIALISFLKNRALPFEVVGNGSNLLFDDAGYRGCLISTKKISGISVMHHQISASAGVSLIALSQIASRESLSGLEFACSIPGTLGGAVYMNAGAYGGEMKDIVTTIRFLDKDGRVLSSSEHGFSYRHSRYQDIPCVLLSATVSLCPKSREEILTKVSENKAKREATQPTKEKSAGSVFRRQDTVIPAKLIDEAGLKGLTVGGASVSLKHAGFIVNMGSATAHDVLSLIEQITETVWRYFGISLETEIRYLPSTKS